MAGLTLVIGNMNYSSWSMRPWVLMKQLGIAFEQVKLRFHSQEWDEQIERWSPQRVERALGILDQAMIDSRLHGALSDDAIGQAMQLVATLAAGTRR